MSFTLLDGILIAVTLISALLAMIRGFTREVFSIISWVAAAAATYMLYDRVLPYTRTYVTDKNLSLGVTVVGIFFITLIVVSFITMRISDFVLDSKAGPLDRTLGFVFGAARGLLLMIIATLFLNFFIAPASQPAWIGHAKFKPWLDQLGNDVVAKLPEDPETGIMNRLHHGSGESDQTGANDAAAQPGNDAAAPAAPAAGNQQSQQPDDPGVSKSDQDALDRAIRNGGQ
ncbi:membrane protein required for colicin V production [Faunimonas pinastri]|uniref:Membrane protein required for colicin V production n=1 Tax=Faunimonas pinastri TaxID=1855383 RepID=A0A1H9DE64_9HYPH|nr:CvpA family protein [Faunimonas pinastri]SEQ11587.1 membrane protein required for colicin V production [Faunimonas pinastri]